MDAFKDFDKLSGEMYRQWEKAMTGWWDQVLDDPGFMGLVGKNLEANVKARGQYQRSVDQTLEAMHLPTRSDIVRLSRIASLLEDRLLSMEDSLLELGDKIDLIEKETVKARIEATETRLELRQHLEGLLGRLDALESRMEAVETGAEPPATGAPADKAPARRTSTRKPAARKES